MDPTGKALLKLLFNEGETVCVSNTKFASYSLPLESVWGGPISLVSPNPKVPITNCDSADLILVAINPIHGYREDSNVTRFRSFLWEIDTGSIKSQLGWLKQMRVPLSAQIFSGNKSVHALTILDEDLISEKQYRYLYQWALNILTYCDQACKNPSRSVRIPGAYREPGKKQRLISMGTRIKLSDFLTWLNQHPEQKPVVRERKEASKDGEDYGKLSIWARVMLRKGIDFKLGRNKTWFALAYDLALAGFSIERAEEILLSKFVEEYDFKEKELLISIASAYKTVEEGRE